MNLRSLLFATALLALQANAALAQRSDDAIAAPVLRASITVSGELVRIGDVVENAGTAAQIAIYRAPDLGTTGTLPVDQVLTALRAHQVIGVDARDLREISVTRLARTLDSKDIELQVARALERRGGLGDASNLSLTFDRDVRDLRLEASSTGAMITSSRLWASAGPAAASSAVASSSERRVTIDFLSGTARRRSAASGRPLPSPSSSFRRRAAPRSARTFRRPLRHWPARGCPAS